VGDERYFQGSGHDETDVISLNLLGETDENHEEPQSG
jgi:hypothetical protein